MDYLLTFDIGGTKILVIRYDLDGRVLGKPEMLPADFDSPEAFGAFLESVGMRHGLSHLRGVGIAVAGSVGATGRVYRSPNAEWLDGINLRELAERTLAVPGAVENDANAFTLAEARDGAGRGCHTVVGYTLGTGIGGGVVLDGHILQGDNPGAGELGHVCIDLNGPDCTCSAQGCLEAFVGGWAIPRLALQLFEHSRLESQLEGEAITGEALYEAAVNGDDFAKSFWIHYARHLAAGVINSVNIFKPGVVVFGGTGARTFPLYEEYLRELVTQNAFPPVGKLRLTTAECDHPGNRGAYYVISQRLEDLARGSGGRGTVAGGHSGADLV